LHQNSVLSGSYSYYNSSGNFISGTPSGESMRDLKFKYEIMGITNENEKWHKQLPLGINNYACTYFTENNIYIECYANDKHDFNNFIYENPFILGKNQGKLSIDAYKYMLRVTPNGTISNNKFTIDAEDSTETKRWMTRKMFKGKMKTLDVNFFIYELYE